MIYGKRNSVSILFYSYILMLITNAVMETSDYIHLHNILSVARAIISSNLHKYKY